MDITLQKEITINIYNMKKTKITFWVSTTFIFLFQGVMPALTGHTEMAKEGMRHLGYPEYFGMTLNIFKVLGTLALMIPQVPKKLKELAYAGFVFDFIFASISIWAVDGFSAMVLLPMVIMAVLLLSYFSYLKLQSTES
jgi:DoxX-like family